jgi:hypothetical protein
MMTLLVSGLLVSLVWASLVLVKMPKRLFLMLSRKSCLRCQLGCSFAETNLTL